jgi:hypothetical protein
MSMGMYDHYHDLLACLRCDNYPKGYQPAGDGLFYGMDDCTFCLKTGIEATEAVLCDLCWGLGGITYRRNNRTLVKIPTRKETVEEINRCGAKASICPGCTGTGRKPVAESELR